MYKILKRVNLNPTVTRFTVEAEEISKSAKAGQFVILRADKDGERIPLTIADYDKTQGTIDVIFQVVGATTYKLNRLNAGQYIEDLVGPLGNPTPLDGVKKAVVIGGGVGCAIAYPIAKQLKLQGAYVDSIVGFRNKELVILEDEFKCVSDKFFRASDDGSFGKKGLVTDILNDILKGGEQYDLAVAIGPLVMMKYVSKLTFEYNIKTIVSMNPIMIDGTGMCGGCRLTVGGETKFACIDGPDFDGHLVDFDNAISRAGVYRDFEKHAYDRECNLFRGLNKNG